MQYTSEVLFESQGPRMLGARPFWAQADPNSVTYLYASGITIHKLTFLRLKCKSKAKEMNSYLVGGASEGCLSILTLFFGFGPGFHFNSETMTWMAMHACNKEG